MSEEPDPETEEEAESLEAHARQIRALEIEGVKQVLAQRRTCASLAFALVCLWLVCILAIAILQGLGAEGTFYFHRRFPIRFKLESGVMIALIATTTANIIAVLVIVMKYIFPDQKSIKQ